MTVFRNIFDKDSFDRIKCIYDVVNTVSQQLEDI